MVPAEVVVRDPVLLVVEDEVLIRISVSDFLRNAGFVVIEAGSAREALAVLKVRADIALVLTDIDPQMLVQQIKANLAKGAGG
jgi:two-component system, response regulator PdtaR